MLWTEREKNKKDEESKGENWPSEQQHWGCEIPGISKRP